MNLSNAFSAIACKKLAKVDLPGGSNQHEVNVTSALKLFFGATEKTSKSIIWRYFSDGDDPRTSLDTVTCYDSRVNQPHRPAEWRLYYHSNFLDTANPDDVLILLRPADEGSGQAIEGLIFQAGSRWLQAAQTLFGISDLNNSYKVVPQQELSQTTLDVAGMRLLDELGIEVSLPVLPSDEELVRKEFPDAQFPTTKEMSKLAREHTNLDATDADAALIGWIEREEALFRALERIIVQKRLDAGFAGVDDFVEFSLSVHNRRKARMGYALQHHLEAIFDYHKLRFKPQAITEGKNKPDFLFPGKTEYDDPAFDSARLIMLAVKSSCKDRWRQILTEAQRIANKHLCTLETAISVNQTDEMKTQHVKLVLPRQVYDTYASHQQSDSMTVGEFVDFVRQTQA